MTYDMSPDASQAAIARSLQQWIRIEIAKGHPARLVLDTIEQEAGQIAAQRDANRPAQE